MKASVRDKEILEALRPLELVAYLRSKGWHQIQGVEDRWATWMKDNDFEVVLPLVRDLGDFALRMADTLRTLEAVEDRSQLEILADLFTASADIMRLRITHAEATDGTIPIEEGAQIVQRARDLVMAGACAAIERRPVFQTRKPNQAVEYLKKVRLGQTERGSYVVTVISCVAPVLRLGEGSWLFELEEPFERQVTATLARAVAATKRAASNAVATGDFREFQRGVSIGVSANLCDAIRGLGSGGEANRGVEVMFSWSRGRPIEPSGVEDNIAFSPDSMPVIEEAARLFRETTPREDFELRGPVVKLERPEGAPIGRVTVLGFVEGEPRRVTLELCGPEYHKVIEAHDQGQIVFCVGSLVREGRAYALQNPRNLQIESDE